MLIINKPTELTLSLNSIFIARVLSTKMGGDHAPMPLTPRWRLYLFSVDRFMHFGSSRYLAAYDSWFSTLLVIRLLIRALMLMSMASIATMGTSLNMHPQVLENCCYKPLSKNHWHTLYKGLALNTKYRRSWASSCSLSFSSDICLWKRRWSELLWQRHLRCLFLVGSVNEERNKLGCLTQQVPLKSWPFGTEKTKEVVYQLDEIGRPGPLKANKVYGMWNVRNANEKHRLFEWEKDSAFAEFPYRHKKEIIDPVMRTVS